MPKPRTRVAIDDMRNWCRGRWWVFRSALLTGFAYMLIRLIIQPNYTPIFHPLDLGIHELGHIVFSPFGHFIAILGGSLAQCAVPVASIFMFKRQRDYFAMAFCLGWLGINLFSVATYAGDARDQLLPLVTPFAGEPIHDWHYLLTQMNLLQFDHTIRLLLQITGAISILTFLLIGAYQIYLMMTLPPRPTDAQRFEENTIRPANAPPNIP